MSNPCRLIAFNPFPPGSFPYEEVHSGVIYKFPDVGLDIESQSREIAKFRKANNFPRASFAEALDDLSILFRWHNRTGPAATGSIWWVQIVWS